MIKIFIITLFLLGCTPKEKHQPGETYQYKDWQCLKTDSHLAPGMSTSGKLTFSSVTTCVVTKCYLMEKTIGLKWYSSDLIKRIKLLDDKECIND